MRALLCTALLATVLTSGTHAFAAAQSVTLLGISGPGGDRFASGIEQELDELYQVVPGDVYRRTAEQMGRRGASPEEVRAVCSSLKLDALVAGAVSGVGAQRLITVVARSGHSGVVVSRRKYELSRRTLVQVRDEVMRDLVLALESISTTSTPDAQVASVTQAPEEPGAADESISSAPSAPRSGGGESHRRPFYFGAGAAIMGRNLSFDTPGSQGYRGTAVGALAIEGGVFPFAFSPELAEAHPLLSAFGVAGSYERAFQFSSSSVAAPSSQARASRWSALLLARIPAGRGGVTIEAGFQRISWSAASQTEVGVPDVSYALVDVGASFEHTLGTRFVELGVRVAAEAMVDAGNLTGRVEYGPAHGGGLDLSAGLTVRPLRWLWVRAGGGYTPLFIAFQSAGGRLAHRATDQLANGLLEVGFAL